MRLILSLVLVAVTLLTALVAQAFGEAENAPYAKLKAFLPPAPDAQACYARTYDAEHQSKHPKQKVTEMILSLRYVTLGQDAAILVATDDGGTRTQLFEYDFTLAAKTRDRAETLYASGDCPSAEAIGCGVDCDGGGIEIEPRDQNSTILVRLERIHMSLGCSEGEDVELEAGEDDKVFKLTKAPPSICAAMQAGAGNPSQ